MTGPQLDQALAYARDVLDELEAQECQCPTRLGCELHGHQPREQAVPCRRGCGRATWAIDAVCGPCFEEGR